MIAKEVDCMLMCIFCLLRCYDKRRIWAANLFVK